MASLSAYFSYDTNTIDRGIPYSQLNSFQYNTGGSIWYDRSVKSNNYMYGTGYNRFGQLGLGVDGVYNYPYYFTSALSGNWSRIVCGYDYTFALSAGTTRWFAAGDNESGQLGTGGGGYGRVRNTFVMLTGNWSNIMGGAYITNYTIAQSAGTNQWFKTGNGSLDCFTPIITGNWSKMLVARDFTFALSANTSRWFAQGGNTYGQLGLGDTDSRSTFTALTGNWGEIVVGSDYAFALSAGTTQWFATGRNNYGNLGTFTGDLNTFTPITGNWSQIVPSVWSSYLYTLAQSAGTNKWYGTGWMASGNMGINPSTNPYSSFFLFTPLPGTWSKMVIGDQSTIAQLAGTTRWYGTGRPGQLGFGLGPGSSYITSFRAMTGNWSQMVCGSQHTMALSARSNTDSPIVVDSFENQPITFKMRPISITGTTGSEASFVYTG